jgi:hypothetical protein
VSKPGVGVDDHGIGIYKCLEVGRTVLENFSFQNAEISVWIKMWLAMQVARPGCTDDKLVSVTLVRHLSV